MAAATITDGSRQLVKTNAGLIEFVQIETHATVGETAVTYPFRGTKILSAFVTSNEAGKTGEFVAAWSGTTVSLTALAGTPGDAATVGLMICGW